MLEFMHSLSPLFSIVAAIFAWRASVISANAKKTIQEVHVLINSRLTELMKVEKALSFRAGSDAGIASREKKGAGQPVEVLEAYPQPSAEGKAP